MKITSSEPQYFSYIMFNIQFKIQRETTHRQDGRGHRAGSGVDSATSGLGCTRAPTLSEPRVRTAPRAGMGVSGTHSPAHAHLRTRGPTHACLHTRTCTHLYHTVQRPVWAIARSMGTFVTGRLVSIGHLCNYFKSGTLSQRSWGGSGTGERPVQTAPQHV